MQKKLKPLPFSIFKFMFICLFVSFIYLFFSQSHKETKGDGQKNYMQLQTVGLRPTI